MDVDILNPRQQCEWGYHWSNVGTAVLTLGNVGPNYIAVWYVCIIYINHMPLDYPGTMVSNRGSTTPYLESVIIKQNSPKTYRLNQINLIIPCESSWPTRLFMPNEPNNTDLYFREEGWILTETLIQTKSKPWYLHIFLISVKFHGVGYAGTMNDDVFTSIPNIPNSYVLR